MQQFPNLASWLSNGYRVYIMVYKVLELFAMAMDSIC